MRLQHAVVGAVALLLAPSVPGCGGDDGAGSTPSMAVTYPGSFPIQGPAPAGAQFFGVSGLTQGTSYTVALAGPAAEPDFDLEVYRSLDPTPPNELCTSYVTGNDQCTFTAPGTTVYVGILNLGGAQETFTLNISSP